YLNSYEGMPFGSLVGQAYQRDPDTGKILLGEDNMPLYTEATHNFGSVLPDFTGGFSNTFVYKNFQLSGMIEFQGGGQFFSRSKMLAVRTGQDPVTVAINDNGKNVRDPLSEGGGVKVEGISEATGEPVTAYVDARSYYRNVVGRRIYEEWLFDASYVKVKEVRLGYNFGKDLLENLPLESVNLALIAQNPLMIWQEAPEGIDPSAISTGSQSISWYESGQLPSVRSFGIDLKLTF
ncbi:MAG TPA: SusC/RagA family TonB-linked outer membrane protein, partial [Salinimicrobium catena]|nr:SusC/RagA family TonB-linked outer membrane protein [Salinimicrobium catena]